MRASTILASAVLVGLAAVAPAQDFGVMESAETINKGNFKIAGNPILSLGEGERENELGLGLRGGYGITDKLDVEAKVAFFGDVSFVGADLEYWVLKGDFDFSVTVGGHLGFGDEDSFDVMGIDLTAVASTRVAERLEFYGALDVALEKIDDAPVGFDDSFSTVHVVPGIEYKLSENIDIVAEFGLGLNDDSAEYLSAGISYYIR
jgi:hypothetical protein